MELLEVLVEVLVLKVVFYLLVILPLHLQYKDLLVLEDDMQVAFMLVEVVEEQLSLEQQ
jgi:hypothetical protein